MSINHCETSMNIIATFFICIFCFTEAKSFKKGPLEFPESGASISFEIQAPDGNSITSDNTIENSVSKNGITDNDQVFCIWEDVHVRDEMATKLGTELCRFSLVRLPLFYLLHTVCKQMTTTGS